MYFTNNVYVLQVVMPKHNIAPDLQTQRIMSYSASGKELKQLRQFKLTQYLQQGSDEEASSAAWSLMDKLVERKLAHNFPFTILFCQTSEEQKKLIASLQKVI